MTVPPLADTLALFPDNTAGMISAADIRAFVQAAYDLAGQPYNPAAAAVIRATSSTLQTAADDLDGAANYARPRVNGIVFDGDSIPLGTLTANSSNKSLSENSWAVRAILAANGKARYVDNRAVYGQTSTGITARAQATYTAAKAARALVVLSMGPNDPGNGIAFATTQANYNAHLALARANRVQLVVATPPPQNAHAGFFADLATWLMAWGEANGVEVIDLYGAVVDPSNGHYQAAYDNGDGVHPSRDGAEKMRRAVSDWIAKADFRAQPALGRAPAAVETSQLFADPCFTAALTGIYNNVPAGWTSTSTASSPQTMYARTLAAPDAGDDLAGNWYRCVFNNADGGLLLSKVIDAAPTPGHRIEFGYRFRAGPDLAGNPLSGITWRSYLEFTGSVGPQVLGIGASGSGTGAGWNSDAAGLVHFDSTAFTIPAGTTDVTFKWYCNTPTSGANSGMLEIGELTARDRTALGY